MKYDEFKNEMLKFSTKISENLLSDCHDCLTYYKTRYENAIYDIITREIVGINRLDDMIEECLISGVNQQVTRISNSITEEVMNYTTGFVKASETSKDYQRKYDANINEIISNNIYSNKLEQELDYGLQILIRRINRYYQDLSYIDEIRYSESIRRIQYQIREQNKKLSDVLSDELNHLKRKNLNQLLETTNDLLSKLQIDSLTESSLTPYLDLIENSNYEVVYDDKKSVHLMDMTNKEVYNLKLENDILIAKSKDNETATITFENKENYLKYTKLTNLAYGESFSKDGNPVLSTKDTLMIKKDGIGITYSERSLTPDGFKEDEEKCIIKNENSKVEIQDFDKTPKETIDFIANKYPKLYENLLKNDAFANKVANTLPDGKPRT